jgi:hypothetical protein
VEVLEPLARHLGISGPALWQELHSAHLAILGADWSGVSGAVATQDDPGPYLVGAKKGFAYGRYGVNLQRYWYPSVFVGNYLLSYDHGVPLLSPELGGDFALILDLQRKNAFGDSYMAEEEFLALRARLRSEGGRSRITWPPPGRTSGIPFTCGALWPRSSRRVRRRSNGGLRTWKPRRQR